MKHGIRAFFNSFWVWTLFGRTQDALERTAPERVIVASRGRLGK